MDKARAARAARDYAQILAGTFIAGVGIAVFSNPAKITGGGVTGVSTIIYYTLGFDPGVTMLCINIPLFLLGVKFFGSKYGVKVLFGAVMLSVWTSVIGNATGYKGVLDYTDSVNILMSAVCYGVLVGGGIGIVMRCGSNTGGTDIVAQIICKYTPLNLGAVEFCLNAVVVCCGAFFFGIRNAIFAFVAMYISGQMISFVVVKFGTSLAKTAYIFSNERVPDISRRVIKELHHGGTVFRGTGIYTSKERNMLMVVVPNHQLRLLERIVHEADPSAFMFISETFQVLGNGFTPIRKVMESEN